MSQDSTWGETNRGPRVGLQFPFEWTTAGRCSDPQQLWNLVSRRIEATWRDLQILPSWPVADGFDGGAGPALNQGEVALVESLRQLRTLRPDVIALGCMLEPAVRAAQSNLGIEIIGAMGASIDAATRISDRIGFVTGRAGRPEMLLARLLERYSVQPVSVCSMHSFTYDGLVAATAGRNDGFMDDFNAAALRCVAAGAEVVIPVCFFFGVVPSITDRSVVPTTSIEIVDPIVALAKSVALALTH